MLPYPCHENTTRNQLLSLFSPRLRILQALSLPPYGALGLGSVCQGENRQRRNYNRASFSQSGSNAHHKRQPLPYRRMKTFTHPRETWDEKECLKRSKSAPADFWGNCPPKGIIASSASSYPEYDQTIRFNGGRVINGEWYEKECRPLPVIPDSFEFVKLVSWGTIIRRKS